MAKVIHLHGIRKKVILSRIKQMGRYIYTVLRPITEEEEKFIDINEFIKFDNTTIDKQNIYCYGVIDINNKQDINYIDKFNLINLDDENFVHSNFDYENGTVQIDNNVVLKHPTWDNIKWFKYNYLLIGKPKRVIIYKCKEHEL